MLQTSKDFAIQSSFRVSLALQNPRQQEVLCLHGESLCDQRTSVQISDFVLPVEQEAAFKGGGAYTTLMLPYGRLLCKRGDLLDKYGIWTDYIPA